jgi:cell division protein FtsB
MAEFQTKKDSRRIWHSPLMLFVLLSILLIFMYNMIGLLEKARETSQKREMVLSQMNSITERQQIEEKNIAKLQTDSGIEETLRDKYHLVKEGEQMVVIVDQDADKLNKTEEKSSKLGIMHFLKNLFK